MNKFLYALLLVASVSQVSAVVVKDGSEGVLSPTGRHGTQHGGMCSTVYTSCDDMQLTTIFPAAVKVRRLSALESTIVISRSTRVPDFKAYLMDAFRITASHRLELNGVEIMQKNVHADGTLITLGDIFTGVAGIPVITVVEDNSRSPLMTPSPQPGTVSPQRLPD